MSTVFRVADTSQPEERTEVEKSNIGVDEELGSLKPVETTNDFLEVLGIEDSTGIPEEDSQNVKEVKNYIKDILSKQKQDETAGNYKRTLNGILEEMGLDSDSEPSIILERISGVIRAWKELTFIKNPAEKRSILSKLLKQQSSKDMNKLILEEMEKKQLWI